MGQIVLQYSTSTAWQSTIIRKMCHSAFSHVDIVMPDGNLLGASDQGNSKQSIATTIEGNPQGVAIRIPDYQDFGIRRQAIYKTDLSEVILEKLKGQLGKPFDSQAMHGMFSDIPYWELIASWASPDCWFCSELIAWAFDESGYWLDTGGLFWPKNRVSPNDLLGVLGQDNRWINRTTFPLPVPGLILGKYEK